MHENLFTLRDDADLATEKRKKHKEAEKKKLAKQENAAKRIKLSEEVWSFLTPIIVMSDWRCALLWSEWHPEDD